MSVLPVCDLRNMIATAGGVDVQVGGKTILGLVRDPDPELVRGDPALYGRAKTVLVATEDLPPLTSSAAITIKGESMKVHSSVTEYGGIGTRITVKLA